MKRYKLKYNWGAFRGTGTVTVTTLGTIETHKMSVGATTIGEYTRRTNVEDDEGETYNLVRSRQLIGKGNLLAGVLLNVLRLAARRKADKKLK